MNNNMTCVSWYIVHEWDKDDEDGKPLIWSNKDGWINKNPTIFTRDEYENLHLPYQGRWECAKTSWIMKNLCC